MKLTDVVPKSCRVCLKRAPKLRSLYQPLDEGEEPPNEMLRLISGVEMEGAETYETLPKFICKNCELSLSLAYQFRVKVLRTHQIIESYRKRMWCTEDIDLETNNSITAQVKEELDESVNSKEYNDEMSINEDHLQNNREMKVEMLELSISEIETIDMGDSEEPEMLELNEDEDMDEECKPEYLYDEEFYNNVDTSKPPTPVEEEHSLSEEMLTFNYDNENVESIDNDKNKHVGENKADPSGKVLQNSSSDVIQVNDLRTDTAKCGKSTKEKLSIKESTDNGVERTKDFFVADQKIDPCTAPEKNTRKSNANVGHICDICGNIYAKRGRMMEHRRRHDKELRFACELCDKRFHLREKLRKHMYLHTGGKPYKCSFCSRTFFYESVRKAHEAVHSGIKPYVCDECNKAFAYAHALAKHKLIHADIKLYHCEYCDKDFRLQHHMKQHIETKLHQNAVFAAKLKFEKGKSIDVAMPDEQPTTASYT